MRHFGKRLLSGIFAVIMISSLLCTAASATVKSSAYLDSYGAVITPKAKGFISVTVDVSGVGYMTEIGATTIYIYESTDGKYFTNVAKYESSVYPQMMGTGSDYYETPITYMGKVGRYYYASVWVYAANENGSDERHCISAVKQAIA